PPTSGLSTLPLLDALPIYALRKLVQIEHFVRGDRELAAGYVRHVRPASGRHQDVPRGEGLVTDLHPVGITHHRASPLDVDARVRSEEHTSELQSRENLVCR